MRMASATTSCWITAPSACRCVSHRVGRRSGIRTGAALSPGLTATRPGPQPAAGPRDQGVQDLLGRACSRWCAPESGPVLMTSLSRSKREDPGTCGLPSWPTECRLHPAMRNPHCRRSTSTNCLLIALGIELVGCSGNPESLSGGGGFSGTSQFGGSDGSGQSGSSGHGGTGGQSGDSGAGGAAGSPGGGGAGPLPVERVFTVFLGPFLHAPEQCKPDGSCSQGTCFHLAAGLGICGPSSQTEAVDCTQFHAVPVPDECGCGGLSCGAGQTCIVTAYTCSCGPPYYNACVETACMSPADCSSGSVCTPTQYIQPALDPAAGVPAVGRCLTPACASDADCTDGASGRCSLLLEPPTLQAGVVRIVGVRCVYAESGPVTEACAGTGSAPAAVIGGPTSAYHSCPNLSH
jgi:hypothetical protein